MSRLGASFRRRALVLSPRARLNAMLVAAAKPVVAGRETSDCNLPSLSGLAFMRHH